MTFADQVGGAGVLCLCGSLSAKPDLRGIRSPIPLTGRGWVLPSEEKSAISCDAFHRHVLVNAPAGSIILL